MEGFEGSKCVYSKSEGHGSEDVGLRTEFKKKTPVV